MHNNVTLLGATGLIGSHVLRLLLEDPVTEQITILLRREISTQDPRLVKHIVDFPQTTDWAPLVTGDTLISCLGTTRKQAGGNNELYRFTDHDVPLNAAKAALQNGVRRMIIVSSLGANAQSRFFYPRLKGELEAALRELPFESLYILRPSFLTGERAVSRPAEQLFGKFLGAFSPLFTGQLEKYKPIEAAAVAGAIVFLLHSGKAGQFIYESDQIAALAKGI